MLRSKSRARFSASRRHIVFEQPETASLSLLIPKIVQTRFKLSKCKFSLKLKVFVTNRGFLEKKLSIAGVDPKMALFGPKISKHGRLVNVQKGSEEIQMILNGQSKCV